MKKLFLFFLLNLFSNFADCQINRNYHFSIRESIIQSFKLNDGKILVLFSAQPINSLCSRANMALFDINGEMIWKNEFSYLTVNQQTVYLEFDIENVWFNINESNNQIFVHTNNFICCNHTSNSGFINYSFKIDLNSGNTIKFTINNSFYSGIDENPKAKILPLINQRYLVSSKLNNNTFRIREFNDLTNQSIDILTNYPSEITFLKLVSDDIFIFGDSSKLVLMHLNGIIINELLLPFGSTYRQINGGMIEVFSPSSYTVLDDDLNVLESIDLMFGNSVLIDLVKNDAFVFYLFESDTLPGDSIKQVRLVRENLITQEISNIEFAPHYFLPKRLVIIQDKLLMYGEEFHGLSKGLSVIDLDILDTFVYQESNKDLEVVSWRVEIINVITLTNPSAKRFIFKFLAKVKNNNSSVDKFNLNFKTSSSWGFHNFYSCTSNNFKISFQENIAKDEIKEFDLGFYYIEANYFTSDTFEFGVCVWTSAPDGKTDDLQVNDMICKSEVIISLNDVFYLKNVDIFPNPTSGILNINTFNNFPFHLVIYNSLGKIVFNEQIVEFSKAIDMRNLANGIYLVNIKDNFGKSFTKKIVKN